MQHRFAQFIEQRKISLPVHPLDDAIDHFKTALSMDTSGFIAQAKVHNVEVVATSPPGATHARIVFRGNDLAQPYTPHGAGTIRGVLMDDVSLRRAR